MIAWVYDAYDTASDPDADSQGGVQQDADERPTTTTRGAPVAAAAAMVRECDGKLIVNGGGDDVTMTTTGARQRSIDMPADDI